MSAYRLGLDIDGTLAADPKMWQSACAALRKAGWEIHLVTACKSGKPADKDYQERREQLASLGFDAFDDLVIVGPPISDNKAKYAKLADLSLYIDNRSENCFSVFSVCPVALFANRKTDDRSADADNG